MKTEYIYYDMQYTSLVAGSQMPHLQFTDNRSTDIVNKASDYKMSIVRFQVDTPYLPSYICLIQPGQSDVNKSIYSVRLRVGDATSPEMFMIWEPVNMNSRGEVVTDSVQRLNNEYYWGYNCQYFLDLLNKQLYAATESIKGSVGLSDLVAPFFRWDNNKVVLYTDADFECEVFFNKALYTKFSSFNLKNWMANNGLDHQIIVDKGTIEEVDGVSFYRTVQEYDTVSNWSPLQSLMFSSSSIPMNFSYAGPAITETSGVAIKVPGSDYNNIITDIQTNENFYKSNLLYVPSGEYRWLSLTGDTPVRDVSIQCFWKDKFGGIHPLRMPSGCSASIKLLFERIK